MQAPPGHGGKERKLHVTVVGWALCSVADQGRRQRQQAGSRHRHVARKGMGDSEGDVLHVTRVVREGG